MKRFASILALICILVSCKEDTVVSQISGVVYYNCSNTPYPHAEVALKTQLSDNGFNVEYIIGGAMANQSGQYNFTYELDAELSGKVQLILLKDPGFTTAFSDLEINKDYTLNLFVENTSTIIVNRTGTKVFAATDSLYVASDIDQNPSITVQPLTGYIDTIYANIPNQYNSSENATFIYGIGYADFLLAKEALGIADSAYNHQAMILDGCLKPTIVDLVIN